MRDRWYVHWFICKVPKTSTETGISLLHSLEKTGREYQPVSQLTHTWRSRKCIGDTPRNSVDSRKSLQVSPKHPQSHVGSFDLLFFLSLQTFLPHQEQRFPCNNRFRYCHCFRAFSIWYLGKQFGREGGEWQNNFWVSFSVFYPFGEALHAELAGWLILDNGTPLQESFLSFLWGCPCLFKLLFSIAAGGLMIFAPKLPLSLKAEHNEDILILIFGTSSWFHQHSNTSLSFLDMLKKIQMEMVHTSCSTSSTWPLEPTQHNFRNHDRNVLMQSFTESTFLLLNTSPVSSDGSSLYLSNWRPPWRRRPGKLTVVPMHVPSFKI